MAGSEAARADRLLARIPLFRGTDVAEFRAWAFVFESVMEQVYPALSGDFTTIRTMDTSTIIVMPGDDGGEQFERCRMLHFALVISCRDEAQIIVEHTRKEQRMGSI